MNFSKLGNIAKSVLDNKDNIAEGATFLKGMFNKSSENKSSDHHDKSASEDNNGAETATGATTYSAGLERMIAMAIEDGELSDENRAVLIKRAEKEGIDPDEFEFELRLRMKKRVQEIEKLQNISPVKALSDMFKMIERNVQAGTKIDGAGLSAALALIPGVGQVAAVGGLVASFIESPSNRNNLKAEIIRVFSLPEKSADLQEFISYAISQIVEERGKSQQNQESIKGFVSSLAMGDELDLIPIWETKLEEACEKAEMQFPDEPLLMKTVKKYRPTLRNKLRNGFLTPQELEDYSGPIPNDPEELVEIVELIYANKNADRMDGMEWSELKPLHAKFYALAEKRVTNNPELQQRLSKCKEKKFGLF